MQSCAVSGLLFTYLEWEFEADTVALITFFFLARQLTPASEESYSPTTFKSPSLTTNHRGQTYLTTAPHTAEALWIPSR